MNERERERLCVCACFSVCVREKERVLVNECPGESARVGVQYVREKRDREKDI